MRFASVAAAILVLWPAIAGAQGKRATVVVHVTVYEGDFQGTVEDGTKKLVSESTLDLSKGQGMTIVLRNDLKTRADEDTGEFAVAKADVTTVHLVGKLTRQSVAFSWNVVEHRRDAKRPKVVKRVSVGGGSASAFGGSSALERAES